MLCRMLRDVHAATQYISVTPAYYELSRRVLQQARKGVRNHSPRPRVPSRSLTLTCRRPPPSRAGSAPVVKASATHLPFRDAAFTAALAILTIYRWPDRARGLTEFARVARRWLVIVTWDPVASGFWFVEDYSSAIKEIDRQILPSIEELERRWGPSKCAPC